MAVARGRGQPSGRGAVDAKGKGRGGPVPSVRPEQQPAQGAGAAAILALSGTWRGTQDETYDVDPKSWNCTRTEASGYARKYHLAWSADRAGILWGEKFCLYAVDIKERGPVRWYRCEDRLKVKVAFTWKRATSATAKAGAPPGGVIRTVKAPAPKRVLPPGLGFTASAGAESSPAHELPERAVAAQPRPRAPAGVRRPPLGEAVKEEDVEELEEEGGDAEAILADAPGVKPENGPGAEAVERLYGVWWGPREELYRIARGWVCERTTTNNRVQRLDLAWDESNGRVLLGAALCFDPADLMNGGLEAPWRPQSGSEGGFGPKVVWERDVEEGEQ